MKKVLIIVTCAVLAILFLFFGINNFFITYELPYFDKVEMGITDSKLYDIKGTPNEEYEHNSSPGKTCVYKDTLLGEEVEISYFFQRFVFYKLNWIVVEFSENSTADYESLAEKVKNDVLDFYDIDESSVKYDDDKITIDLKHDLSVSMEKSKDNLTVTFYG